MSGRITSSPWRLLAVTNISCSYCSHPLFELFSPTVHLLLRYSWAHKSLTVSITIVSCKLLDCKGKLLTMYLSPVGLTGRAILFIFKGLFLPYIHGCFACMYMCTMCKQCLRRPEEGNGVPRTGTTNLSELSCGCKEPDRSPLPEQWVLLTAEQSLQLWLRNILQ